MFQFSIEMLVAGGYLRFFQCGYLLRGHVLGGQGAPLVPFADYILFRSSEVDRIVVNIGGIANLTCLWRGQKPESIRAFDTGPGNCIIDHLMRKHDPSGPGVDETPP